MREPAPLHVPDTLVSWEPGPEAVVSALIDWRVGGHGRTSPTLVLHRIREEFRELDERSPARISLEKDAIDFDNFFGAEADPTAIGYAVFACHGRGLWYAAPVAVPVETQVHVGARPCLLPLLEATQDAARTLVVLANSNSARFIRLLPTGPVEVSGPHREIATIQHSTEGGWGATNYQRHLDVEVQRFARLVAGGIEAEVGSGRLTHIILSGDSTIVPPLLAALPASVRERVDGVEPFDRWESTRDIAREAWERVSVVVRTRRDAEVAGLVGRAAGDHDALDAPAAVREAAATGRVDTLALDPSLIAPAAAETLIREAIRHRSRVVIARGHAALASAGGVVASLR